MILLTVVIYPNRFTGSDALSLTKYPLDQGARFSANLINSGTNFDGTRKISLLKVIDN